MPLPRKKTESIPTLQLSIQYAATVPDGLNRSRLRRWVQTVLRRVPIQVQSLQLTIRFVAADEGRALNAKFRGKDYATNVLTFPYHTAVDPIACADIVVCVPVVQREAREQKKELIHHYAHMIVHAVLHALGFDHETDQEAAAMEQLEIEVLRQMRIENPYA